MVDHTRAKIEALFYAVAFLYAEKIAKLEPSKRARALDILANPFPAAHEPEARRGAPNPQSTARNAYLKQLADQVAALIALQA